MYGKELTAVEGTWFELFVEGEEDVLPLAPVLMLLPLLTLSAMLDLRGYVVNGRVGGRCVISMFPCVVVEKGSWGRDACDWNPKGLVS